MHAPAPAATVREGGLRVVPAANSFAPGAARLPILRNRGDHPIDTIGGGHTIDGDIGGNVMGGHTIGGGNRAGRR